jgi:hypothetical protein
MTIPGSNLNLSGRRAACSVCDTVVNIGRKASDPAVYYEAHRNPLHDEHWCIHSGRPVEPSVLRRLQ